MGCKYIVLDGNTHLLRLIWGFFIKHFPWIVPSFSSSFRKDLKVDIGPVLLNFPITPVPRPILLYYLDVQPCLGVALDKIACAERPAAAVGMAAGATWLQQTVQPLLREREQQKLWKKATPPRPLLDALRNFCQKDFFWQSTTRFLTLSSHLKIQ